MRIPSVAVTQSIINTATQNWEDSSQQRQDIRDSLDGYALDSAEDSRWIDSSEQRQDLRDAADGYALLDGTKSFTGAVTMNSTLDVDGYTTLNAGLGVIGQVAIAGSLTVGNEVRIDTTEGAFFPPRMTTVQRDAFAGDSGMVIFNTTLDEHEGYGDGYWNKLDQDFEAFQPTVEPTGDIQTFNLATGRNWTIDLADASGDVNVTLNNPTEGKYYMIKVIQGPVARDIIWPSEVLWQGGTVPVISIVEDDLDLIQLMWDGANYLGMFGQEYS